MRLARLLVCAAFLIGCGSGDHNKQNDGGGGDGPLGSDGSGGDGMLLDGGTLDGPSCPTNCTLGATSCDTGGVRTCVAMGSCTDWSQPVACTGSLVCSGGQCVATCTNQCALGTAYCSQGGVRACVNAGGCTDWSSMITPCGANTVCSGGACSATCTDRCAPGANQCAGSSVQTCARQASGCYDWGDPVPCSGGKFCSAGACTSTCNDVCTNGATRCSGSDSIQTCTKMASGCTDWAPASMCASGVCASNVCAPCSDGSMRCGSTGNVEQCMSGTWTQIAGCAFGCMNAMCTSMVSCTAGAYRCNGNAVEICNSSGTAWLYNSTCASACAGGSCTGACTPMAKRCNGTNVEQCDATGTTWNVASTCMHGCDSESTTCALASLDVTSNTNLDGEVVVAGPVTIHSGATLTSPTGNLTIRATSITVELGASIVASPTGATTDGKGTDGNGCGYGGGGGGYASSGGTGYYYQYGGNGFGSALDSGISPGSSGGAGYPYGGTSGGSAGAGGGVLKLIAGTITIAGQVTANGQNGGSVSAYCLGGGGGGSGGGILIAADQITISGAVSAANGSGGTGYYGASYKGGDGAPGRVKILSGSMRNVTGTVTGTQSIGLLPPLTITSSTHPDPTLIYNDDFQVIALSWNRPFPSVQGYYERIDTQSVNVPTPANAQFVASELLSPAPSSLVAGSNWFHIAPIDATSTVGTIESNFRVQVNSTPPTVSSSSHMSQTTWSTNNNVFYQWTLPVADANVKGVYYVLDHYGSTVPTFTDTFLPVTQKQLLRSGLANGVWGFHVVAQDQRGYLTKAGGHYIVRIGTDPGSGTVLGNVVDNTSKNVAGATVTVNRELFGDQSTNAMGNYNFTSVPAGTWEVMASAPGFKSSTQMVTVTMNGSATANFQLSP